MKLIWLCIIDIVNCQHLVLLLALMYPERPMPRWKITTRIEAEFQDRWTHVGRRETMRKPGPGRDEWRRATIHPGIACANARSSE
jgi:hypothetical protein